MRPLKEVGFRSTATYCMTWSTAVALSQEEHYAWHQGPHWNILPSCIWIDFFQSQGPGPPCIKTIKINKSGWYFERIIPERKKINQEPHTIN